ncbi:MAG: hypothetical protein LBV23_02165, partial [Deltaproteobacteria bacterium]|nr:hypothetical protein [Deltaproteobacteria bacterium]
MANPVTELAQNALKAGLKPNPRVLAVDDEMLNLKLIQAILKPQGYEVVLAKSGEECLEKANE